MQQLEVEEPLVEERAESAAATVIAAILFGAGVWVVEGEQKGAEFFAGYLLEQSLSGGRRAMLVLNVCAGTVPACGYLQMRRPMRLPLAGLRQRHAGRGLKCTPASRQPAAW